MRENERQRKAAAPVATPVPAVSVTPERLQAVQVFIDQGRLIDAIKEYRQLTGVGLKEAKEAVEAMRDGRAPAAPTAAARCAPDAILRILEGDMIGAIKVQRETTGQGLVEAKAAIDAEVAAMRARGEIA